MLFDIDMKKKIPIREGEDFNLRACLSVDREEKKRISGLSFRYDEYFAREFNEQ